MTSTCDSCGSGVCNCYNNYNYFKTYGIYHPEHNPKPKKLSELRLMNATNIDEVRKPELQKLIKEFKALGHLTVESALCASLSDPVAFSNWFKTEFGLKFAFVIFNLVLCSRIENMVKYAEEQIPDYPLGLHVDGED